ncbi:hypothetical protein BX666DRAFT_1886079 [Dichotomocladium elegans]|nr:hypothetical protein BX666DRAFT_1886079 [Dichotomocladium elegans]
MSGNDSDSSDYDWGIISTQQSPSPAQRQSPLQKNKTWTKSQSTSPSPSTVRRRPGQPTVSSATIRTIRSSLSGSNRTFSPSGASQPRRTRDVQSAQELDYIATEELETLCRTMNSSLLVKRLVETYRNAETFLRIREIETPKLTIQARLRDNLYQCENPGSFILDFIQDLAAYFSNHTRSKNLTPKFQRYLAQAACNAYTMFLKTPPNEYKVPKTVPHDTEEEDLITFDDEPNLISFEEVDINGNSSLKTQSCIQETSNDNGGDEDETKGDDDLVEEVASISLAELLDVPPEVTERYRLTRAHQEACVEAIGTISAPILIYYAMAVFQLHSLICRGGDFEHAGVKLCRLLLRDKHYNEAISCIRKLDLFDSFPVETMAADMLAVGHGNILAVYVSEREPLQRRLLHYINRQLRYTFAGNLGIVPPEYLEGVDEDLKTIPPLPRLKERRFQKDLTACCAKVLQELKEEATAYYFIWLSQRYACLRWIIMERAAQQTDEKDFSIASSSNYNGLIDLVTGDDPALSRLAIKEFVDLGDPVAPSYFAGRSHQQQFFVQYYNRPLNDRAVGLLKGEQLSQPKPMRSKHSNTYPPDRCYALPNHVRPLMVDNQQDLMFMKTVLFKSQMCGLDTEWVPQFARQDKTKTALMQIASDIGYVFLVDIATFLQPTNIHLLQDLDVILRMFFESTQIIKLAYDFSGDFSLLAQCMPTVKQWKPAHLIDFKQLKTAKDEPISGGLSGVVLYFLGVPMNKKQQLSNWEQRPLTLDQATYAASDAYCLLQIYDSLITNCHPFVKSLPSIPLALTADGAVFSPSSTPSPTIDSTEHSAPHLEADLLQF